MSGERSTRWLTSPRFGELAAAGSLVVLVPVGSFEPHGPHLSLETDTEISLGAAERAAARLDRHGLSARVAPPVPYGVTECARAFPGAVSVPAASLTAYLGAVVDGFLAAGAAHVCLVNNHLEPAHDRAVRAALDGRDRARVSVACPLTRRWARTLSDEFKSGACHAGRYETSLALARDARLCDEAARAGLPEVPVSLSDKLRAGIDDFAAMGLDRAYAGAPAAATPAEGDDLFDRLADMVVGEVLDALRAPGSASEPGPATPTPGR
ncbi:MAG TPA: creatininase family protein [Kofleriaceae bacterium]|nr:creatininase family protein [Kofleriaceae bacterium]